MARRKRLKQMPPAMMKAIAAEVKAMLHAQRDELRNRWKPDATRLKPTSVTFDCRSGYYGEAFGIMRALQVLGYGYLGSDNLDALQEEKLSFRVYNVKQPEQNLKWWFSRLEKDVLEEEGYYTDNRCEHCLKKYGKDDKSMQDAGLYDRRRGERGVSRAGCDA